MHPMLFPIAAIVAGILILIYPRILHYVVAAYLIISGILTMIILGT